MLDKLHTVHCFWTGKYLSSLQVACQHVHSYPSPSHVHVHVCLCIPFASPWAFQPFLIITLFVQYYPCIKTGINALMHKNARIMHALGFGAKGKHCKESRSDNSGTSLKSYARNALMTELKERMRFCPS